MYDQKCQSIQDNNVTSYHICTKAPRGKIHCNFGPNYGHNLTRNGNCARNYARNLTRNEKLLLQFEPKLRCNYARNLHDNCIAYSKK